MAKVYIELFDYMAYNVRYKAMRYSKYRVEKSVVAVTFLLLQACASLTGFERPVATESVSDSLKSVTRVKLGRSVQQPLNLIAADFINAVSQIPQLAPNTSSIEIRTSRSKFEKALSDIFLVKGYKVNYDQRFSGNSSLRTSITRDSGSANNAVFTYVVAIDGIALKRSYSIENNVVAPTSSLFVRGANVNSIKLDDRIFLAENFRPSIYSASVNTAEVADASVATPVAAMATSVGERSSAGLKLGDPYICNPEGKGAGTDGWVCRAGTSGKQWISAPRRAMLAKSGLTDHSIEWDDLMDMPDTEILSSTFGSEASVNSAEAAIPGSLYLCTPDEKGVGTDGWLCREGVQGKQWLDASQRASYVRAGTPQRWIDWTTLMAMLDVQFEEITE